MIKLSGTQRFESSKLQKYGSFDSYEDGMVVTTHDHASKYDYADGFDHFGPSQSLMSDDDKIVRVSHGSNGLSKFEDEVQSKYPESEPAHPDLIVEPKQAQLEHSLVQSNEQALHSTYDLADDDVTVGKFKSADKVTYQGILNQCIQHDHDQSNAKANFTYYDDDDYHHPHLTLHAQAMLKPLKQHQGKLDSSRKSTFHDDNYDGLGQVPTQIPSIHVCNFRKSPDSSLGSCSSNFKIKDHHCDSQASHMYVHKGTHAHHDQFLASQSDGFEDQALITYDQNPLFKSHIDTFTSTRDQHFSRTFDHQFQSNEVIDDTQADPDSLFKLRSNSSKIRDHHFDSQASHMYVHKSDPDSTQLFLAEAKPVPTAHKGTFRQQSDIFQTSQTQTKLDHGSPLQISCLNEHFLPKYNDGLTYFKSLKPSSLVQHFPQGSSIVSAFSNCQGQEMSLIDQDLIENLSNKLKTLKSTNHYKEEARETPFDPVRHFRGDKDQNRDSTELQDFFLLSK